MDRLINIIGKAPSEITEDCLLTKLRAERLRVTRGLDFLKTMAPTGMRKTGAKSIKLPKSTQKGKLAEIDATFAQYGVSSFEELIKKIGEQVS